MSFNKSIVNESSDSIRATAQFRAAPKSQQFWTEFRIALCGRAAAGLSIRSLGIWRCQGLGEFPHPPTLILDYSRR
jgi:hypothetical protein